MSASAPRTALTPDVPVPQTRAFLHIVRHGTGPRAVYVLTYHRLDGVGAKAKPLLAGSAQQLLDLLDRIVRRFRRSEVRRALGRIPRLGSARIPALSLSY